MLNIISSFNFINKLTFKIFFRTLSQNIKSKDNVVAKYVKRQMTDEFSKLAKVHNYRARSAFKLLQINEKFNIIKRGDVVLDVGAAPGSWCQVISEILFPIDVENLIKKSYILGVDIEHISSINHVDLLSQADITKLPTQIEIQKRLNGRWLNLILSDMAPKPTGDPGTDHIRIINLCKKLFFLISNNQNGILPLIKGGKFLCKIWDGPLTKEFSEELKQHFKTFHIVKPKASREHSAEFYLYGSGYHLV